MSGSPRVLSIQSHVVCGYVGNKAATFPLQLLGFDVDAVNTVQFSNHTGYAVFTGKRLSDDELLELFKGLERNDLLRYSHVLIGYIGNKKVLNAVVAIVNSLRLQNPDLIFVCDPVMGDDGKLYVPPDLVDVYAKELLPLANILTPNQFEAEQLTGMVIRTMADALACVDALLLFVSGVVVITSVTLDSHPQDILIVVGYKDAKATNHFGFAVERLPCSFSGTGDLFSALILAHIHRTPQDIRGSVRNSLRSIQSVLQRTMTVWSKNKSNMSSRELALIDSKDDIEHPSGVVRELDMTT